MFIAYRSCDGKLYASLVESVRNGNTVERQYLDNLGRVLDREKGIYRNRERGVFTYDLHTNSYGTVSSDYKEPPKRKPAKYLSVAGKKRSRLCLDFGNTFFLDRFLKQAGLYPVIDSIGYGNKDTLRSIVFFYLLSQQSNAHAETWFELNYARILFPNATMASQRISEALVLAGMEESKRDFFSAYYSYIKKLDARAKKLSWMECVDGTGEGILIDSTGLPNSAHLPVTAVSSHNGEISNETRLIYVVQQGTGLPLFFSYVAGNVIDASTIKNVVSHLKRNGINTKFALLDAGYYNKKNADALIDAGISFMSRVHTNHKVFASALREHRASLECRENFIIYNGRFYYIKRIPCKIGEKEDKDAYAYLGLDVSMRDQQKSSLRSKLTDQDMADGDVYDSLNNYGLFMLMATRPISAEKAIAMYYTRNQIEEIFGIEKGNGKLLPLRTVTEETLRWHLLITFIVSVILLLLRDKLSEIKMPVSAAFEELRHQQGIVYDDAIVPSVATKNMNTIYRLFKIKYPNEVPVDQDISDSL